MVTNRRFIGCAVLLATWGGQAVAQDGPLADLEKQLTTAVEKVEKSVVAVARIRKDRLDGGGGLARLERLLRPSEETSGDATVPAELGTGVIVDSRGLVLTTYHLLGDTKEHEYAVWFGRRAWPAKVKAADPWFDLAVLQVDVDDWPAMPLGDSKELKRGQFAIALGNPYAIARDGQASTAWGSVANLALKAPPASRANAESRETVHHYGTLIQTDARIENSASGGALVNLQGEMIGLSSGQSVLAGGERPGSLAIPVDEHFQRTLAALKEGRVPDYGFLGLAPAALNAEEKSKGRTGAVVSEVVAGTPAAQAGILVGDLVVSLNDEAVSSDEDLVRRLSSLHAGTPLTLTVQRSGGLGRPAKTLAIKTRLAKKPVDPARPVISEVPPRSWRGMRVDYSTASPRFRELSRELDPAGCVGVIAVERDSLAWQAGFRPGDFVSLVGATRATTPDEFFAAVAAQPGEASLKLATAGLAAVRKVAAP